jgi:adenylosuccinate synthase
MINSDVIIDLQYGDCGKGKIAHHLLKNGNYTHCIRYNGGCNAGHTIYHDGRKVVTHHIPAGVFYGIKSIIGHGCVINLQQFFKEIEDLKLNGIQIPNNLIKIAKNTHVITEAHKQEDAKDKSIGTTKSGNGPAYRDKYGRTGIRAEEIKELSDYCIDIYEELYFNDQNLNILFEGAQGFGLDIDWGDYPYVTSSHCTVGAAVLNGVPCNSIKKVFGIAKPYETYVGLKQFEPKEDKELFEQIRQAGSEFGATTGRSRQINWMNIDLLIKAIKINGVTNLIINKMDVLEKVDKYKLYYNGSLVNFNTSIEFKRFIEEKLPKTMNIKYSYSPEHL